jgi:osmotically-inducible protein OsmY
MGDTMKREKIVTVHGLLLFLLATQPPLIASADWREVTEEIHVGIDELQPPIGRHNVDIQYQRGGDITLSGYVQNEEVRERIERVARRSRGVRHVDNQLTVATASTSQSPSETQRIREAFNREVRGHTYDVEILSQADRLVLKGSVDSEPTRRHVISIAQAISKRRVDDQLALKMERSDHDVEESIRRALEKEYPTLMRSLEVSVRGGVASLRGDMPGYREVDKVLATVLMVDGVDDIESSVTVRGRRYPSSTTFSR